MAPRVIRVRRKPGKKPYLGILTFAGLNYECALGRSGIGVLKREGDERTPNGRFRVMQTYIRTDRIATKIWRIHRRETKCDDGWCDDARDRNYNRPVKLPYRASHERMFRDDHLYDVCVVLDYNISIRSRNRGSAIFLHLQTPDCGHTQGCIALTRKDMVRLLPQLTDNTLIEILA